MGRRVGEAKRGVCWALAGLLAGGVTPTTTFAHEDPQSTTAAQTLSSAKPAGAATRYQASRLPGRAAAYYRVVWGVDSLSVKAVESDQLIRFAWRVLDADKAKTLNNRSTEPLLIDPQRGVQLAVPSMGQVGPLRQTAIPEAGKSYWMAFSNKGRQVKRGDRINVVIGPFRAEGLVVD
jgi:hypothetical protein